MRVNIVLGLLTIGISLLGLTKGSSESLEPSGNPRFYYMCPPDFIRLGSSCYYFSTNMETWQDANFACMDRDSNLTTPERWEDRNLRLYLTKPEFEKHVRWIGGMYDWSAKVWKWGGEMREMKFQSFAKLRHRSPESLMWHCVAMIPKMAYRWDALSCLEKHYYVCQTKLKRVQKNERNQLRKKWNPNGNGKKPNEIRAPSIPNYDNTVNSNKRIYNKIQPNNRNDLPTGSISVQRLPDQENGNKNQLNNNLIPEAIRRPQEKSEHTERHENRNSTRLNYNRKRPYANNAWRKSNPEAAYLYNIRALKSGKLGLTNAQIEKHLRRLERLRKKEDLMMRRREKAVDNKGSKKNYNEKVNVVRSRNIKKNSERKMKSSHSIESITQRTYIINNKNIGNDNQDSALYPPKILEVHS